MCATLEGCLGMSGTEAVDGNLSGGLLRNSYLCDRALSARRHQNDRCCAFHPDLYQLGGVGW